MTFERHAAQPEHLLKLLGGHLEGTRGRAMAGGRLREGGGARRVKGEIALHLLHYLVDMAVQHRDRAEASQIARHLVRIPGAPTPWLVDRPQRHVRENDDGGARG